MMNLKINPASIKKKVKMFKKHISKKDGTAQKMGRSPTHLSDMLVTAICPTLAKTLFQRDQALSQREATLEQEKSRLQNEKAKFKHAMNAEAEKQSRIKQGATMLFRENRLHSQQELEKQQRAADALEMGLRQATQDELDVVARERNHCMAVLLAATAVQITATSAAVEAKTSADTTSGQLTQALEATQREHLRLQELAVGIEARSKELERQVLSANDQQIKARRHLQTAMIQCGQFEAITQGVQARTAELDVLLSAVKDDRVESGRQAYIARVRAVRLDIAAQAVALVQKSAEKEKTRILREAILEKDETTSALADARAAFEGLRAKEKARLTASHARIEDIRATLEVEKKQVEKEKERVRLLRATVERERAASVDAKQEALGELEQAVMIRDESKQASLVAKEKALEDQKVAQMMRGESRWAIDQLSAIAGEMASPTRSALATKNKSESEDATNGISNGEDGRISKIEVYRDKRVGHGGIPEWRNKNFKSEGAIAEGKPGGSVMHGDKIRGLFPPPHKTRLAFPKSTTTRAATTDENMPPGMHSTNEIYGTKLRGRGNKGLQALTANYGSIRFTAKAERNSAGLFHSSYGKEQKFGEDSPQKSRILGSIGNNTD